MFRKMRRSKQELPKEESIQILKQCTSGTLSLLLEDGYPYGVPVSYLYHEGKIYFHSALKGQKIDALLNHDKVCFTVIYQDDVVEEKLTTYFKSVICFGKARLLPQGQQLEDILYLFSKRYCPSLSDEAIYDEIKSQHHLMHMVEIDIEHLSGKQAIELV